MTEQEFRQLFDAVSTWGRRDDEGQPGALRHLTAARRVAAAQLVDAGLTVSLGRPLVTEARIDVPQPADHHMTMLTDVDIGSGSVRFAKDYVGVDYHNDTHSHLDALSHVVYEGVLYGGTPASDVADDGVARTIEVLRHGLVGRGVLLDVPRVRGVRWPSNQKDRGSSRPMPCMKL